MKQLLRHLYTRRSRHGLTLYKISSVLQHTAKHLDGTCLILVGKL